MSRSLVDWGLDAADDEELRRYCDGRGAATDERAKLLDRTFDSSDWSSLNLALYQDFYSSRRGERSNLSSLMAAAAGLPAAIEWFGRLKQNIAPETGDGDAFHKWLLEGENGIVYAEWLEELDHKVADGSASRRELMAFGEIEKEVDKTLRDLVGDYLRRREKLEAHDAFLVRESARQEREEREAAGRLARAAHPPMAPPAAPRPRRKYGELPPEPEISTYRKRPK